MNSVEQAGSLPDYVFKTDFVGATRVAIVGVSNSSPLIPLLFKEKGAIRGGMSSSGTIREAI